MYGFYWIFKKPDKNASFYQFVFEIFGIGDFQKNSCEEFVFGLPEISKNLRKA